MKNSKELIRSLKFVAFSASAGVIQVASFTLMEELLHWTHWVAYLISLVLSVLWNFTLNRKFTFYSAGNVPVAMLKVAVFYAVFTPVTTFGGEALIRLGWNGNLVQIGTMILNLVTEYLYQRFVVFRSSIDTAK